MCGDPQCCPFGSCSHLLMAHFPPTPSSTGRPQTLPDHWFTEQNLPSGDALICKLIIC